LDSISVMELFSLLGETYNVSINVQDTYELADIGALVDYVSNRVKNR
jgi:acyl carrier protein